MSTGVIVGTALLLAIAVALWPRGEWVLRPIRAQQWARERRGDSPDAFVQALVGSGIEPAVARATYGQLQRAMRASGVKDFPVRADDGLAEMYGLSVTEWEDADNLDLEFLALQIAEQSHRSMPGEGSEPALRQLRTVEELARWVQSLPTRQPPGSAS